VINANGTYTYTPNANFNGTDVIVVSICDAGLPLPAVCVNDTITITVTAVNDAPIVDNETITTNEDTPATGDLTDAGDSDPDGTPLTANTTPVSGPSNGTIVINANGTYTYTPNANFNGTDVIVVSICDAGLPLPGICVNDTIFITVTAVNDAPIVDNEIITTNENTPATGDLTDAGDSDPDGTPLTANTTPVSGPSNGTIVINPDGTYTYTPNPGFSGTDVIVVSICDAGLPLPGVCVNDTITVTVLTVTETNPDMNVTSLNIPVSGNLVTNDDVPVGTTYGTPIGNPSNPAGGTIAMNPDGTYTFTGTNTGVYTYNVPVCAPGQTTNCPTEELIITVLDPNSTTNNPINNTDLATSTTTTPVVINGLSNDASGNTGGSLNPGSLTITDAPNHGTATVNPSTGAVTYTANAGFVGTDTLVYQVCDNSSPTPLCGTAMQIITILPANGVNDGPAASDDYMSEEGTTPATGNVLINDTDPEGNTLNVTPQTTTIPGKGTLVLNTDGTYTFTPVPGFTGTVDIPYTACDNGIPQVCTQATLYITYRVSNTPLYVNLFSFKAKSNACDIDLVWEAKNEVNFSRYEILRKVEGSSDFVKIAEINSKATDDKLVTYNYRDKDLLSNKRYEYKLKMVDMDSRYSFSKTELVKLDCRPKEEIAVYPNPIRGNELYIDLYNEIGTDYKFTLVDMTGRKILESSKTLNNERETVTLSTHHIAAGVYHLLVETPQSSAISYKIIKE
jgi:VCBS repeat-containing protein